MPVPATKLGEKLNNPFQVTPEKIRLTVDAEEDVVGRMQGICVARQMLANDGAQMNFDKALINLDHVCSDWNNKQGQKRHAYSTSAWVNGVVPGEVIWPAKSGVPNSRVWLIKLGWDERAVGRAFSAGQCETKAYPVSCMLAAYYGMNAHSTVRSDGKMYFPQLTTAGAAYNSSTYLFWAYRELGRTAASALQVGANGSLQLKPGTIISDQPILCEKEGMSAVPCTE